MSLEAELALFLAAGAVFTDLFMEKVPNEWIWLGLGTGICFQISSAGIKGVFPFLTGTTLPLILLFPLFLFRMMGGGDIKFLSVLGGILGCGSILKCIAWSFILGAILSLAFLVSCGTLQERLLYFFKYVRICIREHKRLPYGKGGRQLENFHFTIPVFLGIMLYAGGFY